MSEVWKTRFRLTFVSACSGVVFEHVLLFYVCRRSNNIRHQADAWLNQRLQRVAVLSFYFPYHRITYMFPSVTNQNGRVMLAGRVVNAIQYYFSVSATVIRNRVVFVLARFTKYLWICGSDEHTFASPTQRNHCIFRKIHVTDGSSLSDASIDHFLRNFSAPCIGAAAEGSWIGYLWRSMLFSFDLMIVVMLLYRRKKEGSRRKRMVEERRNGQLR